MKTKSSLFLGVIFFLLSSILLTGCQAQNGSNDGFFQHYLVDPFTSAIHFAATLFGGNYGLSIILITLIIRLILLPFMLKQYKNQMLMKDKMNVLKPEMDDIQKKLKAEKDPKKQQELQQQMMGLYKKHGVNPLSMGCLPLLIQMPILTAFYYAIRDNHEIATHNFLWFNLGHSDIIITLIAGIVYFVQFKVSQSTMSVQQKQQMKFMGLLSPIMIVMFSFSAPAALPLYWAVGGTFLIIQSWIGQKLYNQTVKTENALES